MIKIFLAAILGSALLADACLDPSGGLYGKDGDCKHYYMCFSGVEFESSCPDEEAFDPIIKGCNLQENVPGCNVEGGNYIGFVVDDTGSMHNEMVAVKEWMKNCVNQTYDTCKIPLTGGWVLTSFNDPDEGTTFGPTTNLTDLVEAIDGLVANGGGDCPELAFTGITNFAKAIPEGAASCKAFFFSDATAKDESSITLARQALLAKGCTFVPILTRCCGPCEDPCLSLLPEYCSSMVVDDTFTSLLSRRKRSERRRRRREAGPAERLYYDLAHETGGTIFLTDKSSSDDFLEFLEDKVTIGYCPTTNISGPPPLGYANELDCAMKGSCWDSSVGKCYCMSETEPCPMDPIDSVVEAPECPPDLAHGFYPDPESCTRYYECASGRRWNRPCAPGTVFDPDLGICNHAYNTRPPCGTKVV